MKSQNPIETMDVYASTSQYIDGPTTEQQAAGTVPLDTLPADWWNWLWKEMTTRINQASNGMESVYQEVLSVLQAADITPSDTSNTQLLTSINALITKPGTSSTAGTVKSSSASGKVSIDTNGIMTPNGMGVPASLSTTAKTIVSAINEIFTALSTYKTTNNTAVAGKAPTNHASSETTYGKGDSTNYGHVKLSDSTNSTSGVADGIAATPAAVKKAYDLANKADKAAAVADATAQSAVSAAATAQSNAQSAISAAATAQSNAQSAASAAATAQKTAEEKAPISHASTATTYGKGDSTNYGHVKLSDSTNSTSGVADGVAATPAAVSSVATKLSDYKTTNDAAVKGKPSLGSSAGASDTSKGSAGSSSTAARSDHTHPYPGLVYNGSTKSKVTFTLSGNTLNITTTSV